MNLPSISVIIPVYNAEQYLAEAIESILDQSFKPSEIIVINDGSDDKSGTCAEKYWPQVTMIYQKHQGISAARNRGIKKASGDYLAFLDADDIWVREKLQWQVDVFQQNPAVDLVYGHVKQFYSPELPDSFKEKIEIRKEIAPAHLSSAMLIKHQAFYQVGLFDTKWITGIDQEWHMRAVDQKLNMVMLPQVVYRRRLHQDNLGRRMKKFENQRLHILKAAIDRRKYDQS